MRLLKWKDAVGPKRPPQVQSLCDPWHKHKLIPLVHRAAKAGGEGNHRVLTNAWKSLGGHHGLNWHRDKTISRNCPEFGQTLRFSLLKLTTLFGFKSSQKCTKLYKLLDFTSQTGAGWQLWSRHKKICMAKRSFPWVAPLSDHNKMTNQVSGPT